jgi:hypothetical protein
MLAHVVEFVLVDARVAKHFDLCDADQLDRHRCQLVYANDRDLPLRFRERAHGSKQISKKSRLIKWARRR